MSAHEKAEGDS